MNKTLAAVAILLFASWLPAAEPAPWDGLARAEVVDLLGAPDKAKRGSGGRESLVYKLVVVRAEFVPAAEQRLVEVPGFGLCATSGTVAGDPGLVTMEPAALDREGRAVAGGVTQRQTSSKTWTKGEGMQPDEARAAAVGKKLTLRLELGSAGRVESWSAK